MTTATATRARTTNYRRPFGSGILPTMPHAGRMPFDVADLAWLAGQDIGGLAPSEWDALAEESANQDRLDAGVCL